MLLLFSVNDHQKADLSEQSPETGTIIAYLNIIIPSIILGSPTNHTGSPEGARMMLRQVSSSVDQVHPIFTSGASSKKYLFR